MMRNFLLGLVKFLLIAILLLVVTFTVWIYVRGAQPLQIREARGITFWQLIQERWAAYKAVDERVSALPQYLGCRNDILRLLPSSLRGSFNFAYASYKPESDLAAAFRYWEEEAPDEILPKVEQVSLVQVPDAFWRYFSRAYWRGLVSLDYLAGECQLGPVDYVGIMGGV
jgi:hypothetical protein